MGLLKGKIVISLKLLELYFSKRLFLDLTGGSCLDCHLPSRVLEGVTPIQLMTTFYPFIPMLTNLQNRVFGCPAFVHVHSPYRGKLDPRAIKCVFISYAPNKKGYKCYHSQSRKVYVPKDVHLS